MAENINQNFDHECPVCKDNEPERLTLFACPHSTNFCEQCIKHILKDGKTRWICPLCRERLPVEEYLAKTNQSHLKPHEASLKVTPDTPGLLQIVSDCCAIALLGSLIIYPIFMKN